MSLPTGVPVNRGKRHTDRPRKYRVLARIAGALVVAAIFYLVFTIGHNADTNREIKTMASEARTAAVTLAEQTARLDALQRQQAIAARRVIRASCAALEDTRGSLRKIIARGDRNLFAFFADGTISRAQLERALTASRAARRLLRKRDCEAQAAQIPLG